MGTFSSFSLLLVAIALYQYGLVAAQDVLTQEVEAQANLPSVVIDNAQAAEQPAEQPAVPAQAAADPVVATVVSSVNQPAAEPQAAAPGPEQGAAAAVAPAPAGEAALPVAPVAPVAPADMATALADTAPLAPLPALPPVPHDPSLGPAPQVPVLEQPADPSANMEPLVSATAGTVPTDFHVMAGLINKQVAFRAQTQLAEYDYKRRQYDLAARALAYQTVKQQMEKAKYDSLIGLLTRLAYPNGIPAAPVAAPAAVAPAV